MKQARIFPRSLQRPFATATLFALTLALVFNVSVRTANAGAITAAKDTLGRAQVSTQGTHAFAFTTATSLTATQTITITFDVATDAFTLDSAIANTDFSSVTGMTMVANVGACGGGATDEVYPSVDASAPGESYTLTVCTSDTVTAGAKTFTIDSDEITNPSSQASYKVDIVTTSDTGSIALGIVTDDSVNVTATVDPTITFTISDVTIGFGTLTTANARFATGDTNGTATPNTAAHTLALGTNATSGLVLTYNGPLMTSGANDINVATISGDNNGAFGTEQFAIGFDDNGTNFTMVSAYDEASDNYSYVASTTTQILSSAGPVASTNVDAHYLANIAANTPAGSYATDITYVATGTY